MQAFIDYKANNNLDVSEVDQAFERQQMNRIGSANGVIEENVYHTSPVEDLKTHGVQSRELDLTGGIELV